MSISRRITGAVLLGALATWCVTTLAGCGGAACVRNSDCGNGLECQEGACLTPDGKPPATAGTGGASAGTGGTTSTAGSGGTTSMGGTSGSSAGGKGGSSGMSGMAGTATGGMSGSSSAIAGTGDVGGSA